jgi:dihydrofolate reductase
MARFKALTTGHTVLMGRKTFESFKRPKGLPNRHNVVVTRDKTLKSLPQDEPCFFSSEENPLKLYIQVHQACLGCTAPDIWIIGGASIYQQAIEEKLVDEIYLTQVHAQSGGDVLLPFELWSWKLFVIRERARGVNWEVEGDAIQPPTAPESPHIVFIKLTKVKE